MAHLEESGKTAQSQKHSTIRIYTLGTFHIEWEQQPLPQERLTGRGAAPALGLLKALVTRPDRFAVRDWLMEQFWPDSASSKADERLDDVASGLRTLLRPPGSTAKILHFVYGSNGKGSGYRLENYPFMWVDADAFEWYVEQAARLDRFGHDSLPLWEQAYQLASRGEFLPEERYSDWAIMRRERLEGHYRQCVHRLVHLLQEAGAHEEALLRLRTYWQQYQTDEDALRLLIESLGKQERYQEAEGYYQRLSQLLSQEGQEPDHRTQDLIEYLRSKQLRREQSMARTINKSSSVKQKDTLSLHFSPIVKQDIIETLCDFVGRDDMDQLRRQILQHILTTAGSAFLISSDDLLHSSEQFNTPSSVISPFFACTNIYSL